MDSQHILVYLAVAIIFLSFAAIFSKGLSAYSSIFGGNKFGYKFDKTQMPLVFQLVTVFAALAFTLGMVVVGTFGDALAFCLLTTAPVGISLTLLLAYVPR